MTTATAAPKASKGFNVTCPHCHDTDDTVTIDIHDLTECRCSGLDKTFTAREARDLVAKELARCDKDSGANRPSRPKPNIRVTSRKVASPKP